MRSKYTLLIVAALLLGAPAAFDAQSYHVVKQTLLGGEGGWDYVTVDPDAHRIYVPRGTHVMVLDESTHKVVADIPGMKGIHGVAIAPDANRGFVTGNDPKGVIYVFDVKTNQMTLKIPTNEEDCDGIMYDPATRRIYVNNADAMTTTVIDPATAKVVGSIKAPGPLEAGVSDGKGTLFENLVDSGEVAQVDAKTMTVKATWSAKPCERGYGAGVVNIFHEESPDKYAKVADVKYMYGARTVALDPKTHHIFSIGATKN